MTSSSQLRLDNLPGHCCHLGISGISFSDMSGQHTHVESMLYCTEYVPEGIFVVNGENNFVNFGQLLLMSVSEHITHPLINGLDTQSSTCKWTLKSLHSFLKNVCTTC